MKLLAIGDNVADCYVDKGVFYPGGNAVNVAVGARRNSAYAAYIGIFGGDRYAAHIQYALEREKVDISRCRKTDLPSGQPEAGHTAEGDRFFIRSRKDTCQHMVRLGLIDEDYEYIKEFDHAHTSVYSYMDDNLERLSKHIGVSYDFSNRAEDKRMAEVCPFVNIAFFSSAHLTEAQRTALISQAHTYGAGIVGLTLGDKGAMFSNGNKLYYQGIKPAHVVDTMGAGDGFIAAFLVSFISGDSMETALDKAASYAAVVCGEKGAFGYGKEMGS